MSTPSIQTLITQAQQVLNLKSSNEIRATLAAVLANANVGTPLNPNLTTQQLWDEFYEIVRQPSDDIMSIITDQMMRMVFSPPAPGGAGADKQVIFNDGGVLAGDAGLMYNKATDALTITGDLTVDTSTLKVDSTNNRVGIGTASPAYNLDVIGSASIGGTGSAFTRFTSNGGLTTLGVGAYVSVQGSGNPATGSGIEINGGATPFILAYNRDGSAYLPLTIDGSSVLFKTSGSEKARIDATGNLGLGVTPSAWDSGFQVIENSGGSLWSGSNGAVRLSQNAYYATSLKYKNALEASQYVQTSGQHQWYTAPSGTAGNAITFTQAMTLDASGNLLVGTTSGTYHIIRKNVASDAGNVVFEIQGNGGTTSSIYYGVTGYNANAANAASKFGRDVTTLRSINAGGTVNVAGADYAEYMVKCSDFILSKGDVAGIDANGKLTNVFADAVSFVVKSTDPSYVGNDKWGIDLEGDALEAARQLVDRIAFAGQVPVNVIGATAGDYIVPVVNGTGIKGISVSKPTFEQYQLAVGKVIAIDTDGRARIIVKVA
jgi:hypothetical protein